MKGIVIGISVAAIIAVTIVIVIFVVVPIVKPIVAPPQVQLTSHSGIFDQQILISGRVANSGMSASNPVSLGITITDPNGNILYL